MKKIDLAVMYYDFVKDYNELEKRFDKKNINRDIDTYNKQKNNFKIIKDPELELAMSMKVFEYEYMAKNTIFSYLVSDRETSINRISNKLKNKKGIQELISNLDEEINYSCYHLSIIKDLDYITHDLIKPKDLEIVIDRNFENDDCYDKKYYELYLRYKLLDYELTNYYEKCKEVNHDLDMT